MKFTLKWQRIGLILLDALLIAFALYSGYLLRFNFRISALYERQFVLVVGVFVAVRLILYAFFNLYRGILRYASTSELVAILLSGTLGSLILGLANLIVVRFLPPLHYPPPATYFQRVPWPVVIIEFGMTVLLVGGARFSRRLLLWTFS